MFAGEQLNDRIYQLLAENQMGALDKQYSQAHATRILSKSAWQNVDEMDGFLDQLSHTRIKHIQKAKDDPTVKDPVMEAIIDVFDKSCPPAPPAEAEKELTTVVDTTIESEGAPGATTTYSILRRLGIGFPRIGGPGGGIPR